MIKRMTAVILAVVVMCGTVMGNYQEAQAAEFVAGIGLAEILTSFYVCWFNYWC